MKPNDQKPKQINWIKVANILNDKLELCNLKKI